MVVEKFFFKSHHKNSIILRFWIELWIVWANVTSISLLVIKQKN